MYLVFEKPLKQTKTDRYGLDVTPWLDGQPLATFAVTAPLESGITVGTVVNDNNTISVLLTAGNIGRWDIDYEYSTSTRSDCQSLALTVIEHC